MQDCQPPFLSITRAASGVASIALAIAMFTFTITSARAAGTYDLALYNTGESTLWNATTQTAIATGSTETEWGYINGGNNSANSTSEITTLLNTTTTTSPYVTNPNAAWVADDATSKWISDAADSTGSTSAYNAFFDYRISFVIPTNAVLSSVSISFSSASDNYTYGIYADGTATGLTDGSSTASDFSSMSASQTINSSNATFKYGTNTLDFVVDNQGASANPEGLKVSFSNATVTVVTPEPDAVLLLGSALLPLTALMTLRRRRLTGKRQAFES